MTTPRILLALLTFAPFLGCRKGEPAVAAAPPAESPGPAVARPDTAQTAPVDTFATLSAGNYYTCGLTTGGAAYCSASDSASQAITIVEEVSGSFVVLNGSGLAETGPARALLVRRTRSGEDMEAWFPDLVVLQQVGDDYRVVARTEVSGLNYDFISSEDTGSRLSLTSVPVGLTASVLAVTLRTSRGSDNFGEVQATTVLYAVQDSALRAVLDLETESVYSELTLGRELIETVRGTTTTLETGTGTAPGLKDVVATTTEFTVTGSVESVVSRTSVTFVWDAELLEYTAKNPR